MKWKKIAGCFPFLSIFFCFRDIHILAHFYALVTWAQSKGLQRKEHWILNKQPYRNQPWQFCPELGIRYHLLPCFTSSSVNQCSNQTIQKHSRKESANMENFKHSACMSQREWHTFPQDTWSLVLINYCCVWECVDMLSLMFDTLHEKEVTI